MARIPEAVSLLSQVSMAGGKRQLDPAVMSLQKLLIAAILHSEDECLVLTESELSAAGNYSLVTMDIAEEKAISLTVRPK